jgi:hypothetical protein
MRTLVSDAQAGIMNFNLLIRREKPQLQLCCDSACCACPKLSKKKRLLREVVVVVVVPGHRKVMLRPKFLPAASCRFVLHGG